MADAAVSSPREAVYTDVPSPSDKEVRLARLQPGTGDAPIACTLEVAPLTAKFEALSYTWSKATSNRNEAGPDQDDWEDVDDTFEELQALSMDETTIRVNGHEFTVTPNLHQALKHLRDPEDSRTLWVDYLCINQQDVSERNEHVGRMDTIYKSATRVVVWLGPDNNEADRATGELLGLAANVHLTAIYPGTVEETRARIHPLVELLNRAWFSRVWVVQEVALAREAIVQIGSRTVPWDWFLRAARVYREHLDCCGQVMSPYNDVGEVDDFLALKNGLGKILTLDREALRGISLHTALRLYYERLASDPRDKVYALLGLLRSEARLVSPDYALTAEQVYEEVALKLIQRTGDLSIFTDLDEYAGDVETASWAPDWTTSAAFGLEFYEHFRAAGSLGADARLCSARTLKISGLIFDTVTDVVSDETEDGELLRAARQLQAWEALALADVEGPSPYCAGAARTEAFWRTVMMDMDAARTRRATDADRAAYDRWRHWLVKYATARDREAFRTLASRDVAINQHNAMAATYPDTRWFFRTEDGYFGLGPVEMEADDVVCVLYGGKVPFVLRALDATCDACDNGQLCYKMVGFAYVHGIMDGETVRGIEADEEVGLEFCIR